MKTGDTILSFRKQEWTFVRVSRVADKEAGRDGKVIVKDEFDREREFYWTVFPDYDFTKVES